MFFGCGIWSPTVAQTGHNQLRLKFFHHCVATSEIPSNARNCVACAQGGSSLFFGLESDNTNQTKWHPTSITSKSLGITNFFCQKTNRPQLWADRPSPRRVPFSRCTVADGAASGCTASMAERFIWRRREKPLSFGPGKDDIFDSGLSRSRSVVNGPKSTSLKNTRSWFLVSTVQTGWGC